MDAKGFIIVLALFVLAGLVALIVNLLFRDTFAKVFTRIIQDDISTAWQKYISFATYVVGISSGVEVYNLERYITDSSITDSSITIGFEILRVIVSALQSISWLYLIVFVVALIAFVIVRGYEIRHNAKQKD